MSSKAHKEMIWSLIKEIKVGMLVTKDGEHMRARPMQLVQEDYDGFLWFFTDLNDEKMQEVDEDHHVCVTFSNPDDQCYVSLSGVGRVSRDSRLINDLWNPFVAAWFPEGKDAHNVGLIEIDVKAGEHWNADSSSLKQLYELGKATFTDSVPDIGQNEKFGEISE